MTQSILQSYYLSSFLFIFLNPLHRFLEALIRLISESFEPIAPILLKITFYWPASVTPSVLQIFLLSSILNLYPIPLVRLFILLMRIICASFKSIAPFFWQKCKILSISAKSEHGITVTLFIETLCEKYLYCDQ